MGKGDRRTRRGKIWRGTYGVSRPKKKKKKAKQQAQSMQQSSPGGEAK